MKDRNFHGPKFLVVINIFICIICLLAIACYFFGALWELKVTYALTADQIEELINTDDGSGETPDDPGESTEGSDESAEESDQIDLKEILGDESIPIHISIRLNAIDIFKALGSPAESFKKVVNDNVDNIVKELMPTLNTIAKKTVKTVAKKEVKKQVHSQVKDYLANNNPDIQQEEVDQKLEELGITDDYISEKTDKLVDDIFSKGGTVDSMTESVMETVDTVYEDLKKNSEGKDEFKDFQDIELTDDDRKEIEDSIREVITELADEKGNIDPEELIAQLLDKALNGELGKDNEQEQEAQVATAISSAEESCSEGGAESDPEQGSATDKLVNTLQTKLNDALSEEMLTYMGYSFYVIFALIVLSMIPWLYVLIKLIVKFATGNGDTTVKLKWPIWFGWLFFLLFAGIPSLAFGIIPKVGAIADMLGPDVMNLFGAMKVSVFSISFISAVCALCTFVISIYYMIVRRHNKKALKD